MNKRILFINKYTTSSMVPDVIAGAGYRVDIAAGPESVSTDYDVIILLENPGTESWVTCARIRREYNIPLIVISGNASAETCVKAINAGADYFMRKSFGPLELLARINSLIQHAAPRTSIPEVSADYVYQ